MLGTSLELNQYPFIWRERISLTGIVRAPSLATFSLISSAALPACAFSGLGGCATIRSSTVFVAISSPSRRFHSARTSADGAHPKMPGCINPAKRTCGMCREEQKIPSKSQMAFALPAGQLFPLIKQYRGFSRFGVQLVQKASSILLVKDPRESPWLVLERLHILNFDYQHIAWLG